MMRQSKRFQAQCPQVFPEGNRTFSQCGCAGQCRAGQLLGRNSESEDKQPKGCWCQSGRAEVAVTDGREAQHRDG